MIEINEIEKVLAPLFEQESAELVHLSFGQQGHKMVLEVFIDKDGGVTLDDCSYFSDRIGSLLDSSGIMDRPYILEVSSPGLDRLIKKEKDFIRFAGNPVAVRLKQSLNGRRNFKGKLCGWKDGKVLVECEGQMHEFLLNTIDEVRLDVVAEI